MDDNISELDSAHAMRLSGDRDGSLRLALTLLEQNPSDIGASALVARLLVDAREPVSGPQIAERLVDAFSRRGDLAQAVVAAQLSEPSRDKLHGHVAEIFGKGSPHRGNKASLLPPPLPAEVNISPSLSKSKGKALLATAEQALEAFIEREDPVSKGNPVPGLPLFGALDSGMLKELLGVLEVRELNTGEDVIHQGDVGDEAFVVARGLLEARVERGDKQHVIAQLGPGAIFGEMALVSASPRAASVATKEPVQLLVISRARLEDLADRVPAVGSELASFCYARMVNNLMRHSEIFRAIQPSEREGLISHFSPRSFESGDALVRRDQETEGLYLIASGAVRVIGRDDDGDQVQLAELGPGDVVGEISLVLRRPATADVVASNATVALELTRDTFLAAIKRHPTLLTELYEIATKREEETRTVVAQDAMDVEDVVLL